MSLSDIISNISKNLNEQADQPPQVPNEQVNQPPVIVNSIADQSATEDQLFTFTLGANTFLDIQDGSHLTLHATLADGSPLPEWLSFDSATRQFSGTPEEAHIGDISIRVTATDSGGLSTFDDFVINVGEVNDPPVVQTAIGDQNASEDQPFTFEVPVSTFADEENGSSLTLLATLVDGSPLPDWLSFDGTQFSGTPLQGDIGDITIRITATDAGGQSVFDDFRISVSEVNDPPLLQTAIADQSANEGQSFAFDVPVSTFIDEEDGSTLTLSATLDDGSALPGWLSFDPGTGQFSGTPTIEDTGDVTVRVTATDAGGLSVFDDFVLSVTSTGGTDDTTDGTGGGTGGEEPDGPTDSTGGGTGGDDTGTTGDGSSGGDGGITAGGGSETTGGSTDGTGGTTGGDDTSTTGDGSAGSGDITAGGRGSQTFIFTTDDLADNSQPILVDTFDTGVDQLDISDFNYTNTDDFNITEINGDSLIDFNTDGQQDVQVVGVTGLGDGDFIF